MRSRAWFLGAALVAGSSQLASCAAHGSASRAVAQIPSAAPVSACPFIEVRGAEENHLSLLRGSSAALEFLATVAPQMPEAAARDVLARAAASGEVSLPAPENEGNWRLLAFPPDRLVALNAPPERDAIHPPTSWTIEREGAFAIHRVEQAAYVCPTNDEDVCVSWNPRQQNEPSADDDRPREFFCTDERALPCQARGSDTSELYILDTVTGRTVKLGPFARQDKPRVTAGARSVVVAAQSCQAEISF